MPGRVDPESEKKSDGLGAAASAERRDLDDEQASVRALESDASSRPAIADSMRRAEVIARSTAARLYGTDQDGEAATHRRDITDAARDDVARDGGLRAPAVTVPPAAAPAASEEDVDVAAAAQSVASAVAEQQRAAAEAAAKAAAATREAAASKEAAAAKEAAAKRDAEAKMAAEAKKEAEAKKLAAAKKEAEAATQAAAQAAAAERKAAAEQQQQAAAAGAESASAAPTPDEVRAAVERVAGGASESPATDAASADAARTAPVPHRSFTLGRVVRVADGDTVWDIAIKNYGSAGPAVLKRILVSNPGVRDPLRLEVGSMVFLPYSRPDQMVHREASGFRVVLASGTSRERLEELARWASTIAGEVRLTSSAGGAGPVLYELSVAGISSEAKALSLATTLLENASSSATERTAMR